MNRFRSGLTILFAALGLLVGCNVHVNKDETASGGKNANITTPFGSLKVETNNVSPKDAGLQAYPGARLVPKEGKNDSDANVNIDTPWFGLRVVALKYESDDSPDKIWDFYKKDMAQYGRVLECKPGSPDMDIVAKDKEDLTCHDRGSKDSQKLNISPDEPHLKVGTENHQRVVAFKRSSGGTKFSLVYVAVRGDDKDKS